MKNTSDIFRHICSQSKSARGLALGSGQRTTGPAWSCMNEMWRRAWANTLWTNKFIVLSNKKQCLFLCEWFQVCLSSKYLPRNSSSGKCSCDLGAPGASAKTCRTVWRTCKWWLHAVALQGHGQRFAKEKDAEQWSRRPCHKSTETETKAAFAWPGL